MNTFWSQSLPADYSIDQTTLSTKLARLANEQTHPASNAQPVIVNGTALLLTDKVGQNLDQAKLKDGILTALKGHDKVVISTTNIVPTISADAYKTDVAQAQSMLGLNLSIKIRTKTIQVSSAQLGLWLRFGAPGSGVSLDTSAIAYYVNSLGAGFDRSAAASAIESSLQSVKPLAYTASVRHLTSAKVNTPVPAVVMSYHYCLALSGTADSTLDGLASKVKSVYNAPGGWSLGGAVSLQPSASACNFTIWLASNANMSKFSPACSTQSTCRVENDLVINEANWSSAPTSWKGTLDEYRTELINHETGHWLGFDHLSCNGATTTAPIQDVVVQVAGCSPRWYPIAADLQPLKILPGF
jgi:hypothetical protein